MTVAALPSVALYLENGGTIAFAAPFRFKAASDLVVERLPAAGGVTVLTLGIHYTVTGGGTDAGGTVTLTLPGPSGGRLRIRRRTARAQPMVYTTDGRFPAKSHEEALDRGMLIAQELDDTVTDVSARALLLPEGESAAIIPGPATRAGGVLTFDPDTGAVQVTPQALFAPGAAGPGAYFRSAGAAGMRAAPITDRVSILPAGDLWTFQPGDFSGVAASELGVTIDVATGIPLSQGAWVARDNVITPERFGANGRGVGFDRAAIQEAIDFLDDRNGGTLALGQAVHRLDDPIELKPRVRIAGVGGHLGSRIIGTHGGPLFQAEDIEDFLDIDGVSLEGAGCTGILQSGNSYLQALRVTRCDFSAELVECIYGNLIFAHIEGNLFGYHGTAGAQHRHIVSLGIGGSPSSPTNRNFIGYNRFYNAIGNESCRIENGILLDYVGNNPEQNRCLPLRLLGVKGANVENNFFEKNSRTDSLVEVNVGSAIIDNAPLRIVGNHIVPLNPGDPEYAAHNDLDVIVKLNTPYVDVLAMANTGDLTGLSFANNPERIAVALENYFTGFSMPNRIRWAGAAPIANPSGGATVDAEARTAINAVLTMLRAQSLVQP